MNKQITIILLGAAVVAAITFAVMSSQKNQKETPKTEINNNQEMKESASAGVCLLYTSPSPRDRTRSRMPSSA